MLHTQTIIRPTYSLSNITIYIISVSISNCSWYTTSTQKFWIIYLNNIQLHDLNKYLCKHNASTEKIYTNITTQTCIFDLHTNASLLLYQLFYQQIWMQSIIYTFILPWNLVTCVGKVTKIYPCFYTNQADIPVSLHKRYIP